MFYREYLDVQEIADIINTHDTYLFNMIWARTIGPVVTRRNNQEIPFEEALALKETGLRSQVLVPWETAADYLASLPEPLDIDAIPEPPARRPLSEVTPQSSVATLTVRFNRRSGKVSGFFQDGPKFGAGAREIRFRVESDFYPPETP